MSVDVKALRALLDEAKITLPVEAFPDDMDGVVVAYGVKRRTKRSRPWSYYPVGDAVPERIAPLLVALLNSAPDLLTLAEAVRDLAGPIAMLVDPDASITVGGKFSATALNDDERDAARRVLAILEGK